MHVHVHVRVAVVMSIFALSIVCLSMCIYRYHMISSKKSGVISGWQLEPNGDILYSETLPSDTIISESVTHVYTCVYIGHVLQSTCTCIYTYMYMYVHVFCEGVYTCTVCLIRST